jgi:hypothetical protein
MASASGVANDLVQAAAANTYYPIQVTDNTSTSYSVTFDVSGLPANSIFYIKNSDVSNQVDIGIRWTLGYASTNAIFFGGASSLFSPGSGTNGSYSVCQWTGSFLNIY